jgi:hypothetical protein
MSSAAARLIVCVLLLHSSSAAADAASEKAVRMKTSRQLKEILTELKIKVLPLWFDHSPACGWPRGRKFETRLQFPKDADKDDLREIAVKHDAVSKWEALHPEKKKQPRGPAVEKSTPDSMAGMMFDMMDKDKDGKLTSEEMAALGGGAGSGDLDESFKQIDADGDGFASRDEVAAFFKMLSAMSPGMGGDPSMGAGTGAGGGASQPKAAPKASEPNAKPARPRATPAAAEPAADDDELPSHDEL